MFDLFRSRDTAVRILLAVILGVVAISMVAYLIPNQGTSGVASGDDTTIAKIGDEKISTTDAIQAIQTQMRGRQIPAEIIGFYAPQAIQQLINQRAMAYEAQRLGIQVTDDDVYNAIRQELPPSFFKTDGSINQDMLSQALEQQNATMSQFLSDTRRQLLVNRLQQIVTDSIVVTRSEVEKEYTHRNEKIKIDYVLVKPAAFEQQVQVAPAEIEAYFNSHRNLYSTPEKKSLAIVLLDGTKLEQGINPTDADLQAVYNGSVDRFRTPDQVKVRHILITTDATTTDAQAQAKAADVLKQLKAGADFADMAKKYSKDPGSANKGGDVGFITHGQMVKPFEDAAFSLKQGELSGLVKTSYGYHILQVEGRQDARVKPFAEVKDVLTTEFKKRKANEALQQLTDKAAAELKKDPAHPEKAAADAGGELVTVSNVKNGDPLPKIGVNPPFQNSLNGLKAGEVSAPVNINPNLIAIAEVTGTTPVHPSALDEVRPQVEAAVKKQKLDDMVQKKITDLAAKAKADGDDLAKAAKEMGLEMKESTDFNRQGAVEGLGSASALSEAFPAKDGSIVGPVNAADGKALVKVISHTTADMSGFAAQQATMREELKSKASRERLALFQEGLRKQLEKDGKIKIQTAVIDKLVQGMRG
jgi:peptidyl-prolyl cis-trans isomerase D